MPEDLINEFDKVYIERDDLKFGQDDNCSSMALEIKKSSAIQELETEE